MTGDRAHVGTVGSLRAGRDADLPDDYYASSVCVCGAAHISERHQQCPRCQQVFNGTTIGDAHLVRKHPPAGYEQGGTGIYAQCPCEKGQQYHHYCLNTADMRDRGWWQDDHNVWHQPGPDQQIRSSSNG